MAERTGDGARGATGDGSAPEDNGTGTGKTSGGPSPRLPEGPGAKSTETGGSTEGEGPADDAHGPTSELPVIEATVIEHGKTTSDRPGCKGPRAKAKSNKVATACVIAALAVCAGAGIGYGVQQHGAAQEQAASYESRISGLEEQAAGSASATSSPITGADEEKSASEGASEEKADGKQAKKDKAEEPASNKTAVKSDNASETVTKKEKAESDRARKKAKTRARAKEHGHKWVDRVRTIGHRAITKKVRYPARYEVVTEYHTVCNTCGEVVDGHAAEHAEKTGHAGWTTNAAVNVRKKVSDAHVETVIVTPAYKTYEKDGQICKVCGKVRK